MVRSVRIAVLAMMAVAAFALLAFGVESNAHQEGRRLYDSICASCHGKLEDSAKAGRSMGRIRSAIRTFSPHQPFASSLTDEHLLLIALALKDVPE